MKELGHTEVDVSVVNLDEKKEKLLNIALNKIQGKWEIPLLKDVLSELDTGELDLTMTGFSQKELENLFTKFGAPDLSDEFVPDREDNIMVSISFHPGIWLGKREEVLKILDKIKKTYEAEYRIKE